MAAVYPEYIVERNAATQDSIWFQNDMNPVATVVHNGKEASIYCVGDVRVRVEDFVYRNVGEVIDAGITNDIQLDEAVERGDIEFLNNNWFELFDPALDDVTGIICHTIADAVEEAVKYVTS
jgi:hypothetical protein